MQIRDIYQIAQFCRNNKIKNIYMFVHKNPDADALGSAYALSAFLERYGFFTKIIIRNDFDDCNIFNIETTDYVGIEDFVAIFCDCSSPDRLENKLWKKAKYFIKIDHHEQNDNDINYSLKYVDVQASSTCEIVASFLMEKPHIELDRSVYDGLYYGILTDTGEFTYALNNEKTFRILSWLIEKGAQYKILHKYYNQKTLSSIRVHSYILKHMKIYRSKKIALCEVNLNVAKSLNVLPKEFSRCVNLLANVDDAQMWCTIVEVKPNRYSISLRSDELSTINVEEIARKFGGGGHIHSAGCLLSKTKKDEFLKYIEKNL